MKQGMTYYASVCLSVCVLRELSGFVFVFSFFTFSKPNGL